MTLVHKAVVCVENHLLVKEECKQRTAELSYHNTLRPDGLWDLQLLGVVNKEAKTLPQKDPASPSLAAS